MTHKPLTQRQLKPEFEHNYVRSSDLGYESIDLDSSIRCLAHGFPTPLARWHYHDEYELHLITATSGKVFVGDWIGRFAPGHLVLTGPRLPHNWVSMDLPNEGVAQRDLVIQFPHAPVALGSKHIPELLEVLPMLERAKYGIEFFGLEQIAQERWHRVKAARGVARFGIFCELLSHLSRCTDYRLLSSVQLKSVDNDEQLDQINTIFKRITDNLMEPLSAAVMAQELAMTESQFSRFFKRTTGNTFTDFVGHVRINRACQLLMETDRRIAAISVDVGFQNMANFNRRFLAMKGVTPSDYRKQSANRFGLK
ncbi:MAG: AraC family transcriptional regulator [Cytophagales bacterium]|nr:AraC family transcriptional regulator [Cytophagales bacterium]